MVEQLYVAPEAGFTLRDDRIHCRNLFSDLVSHLLHRQAPRLNDGGGFSSGGHVPNPTTTKVSARCAMEARVASGFPFLNTLSNPVIVPV
jgi:hypothetical protein